MSKKKKITISPEEMEFQKQIKEISDYLDNIREIERVTSYSDLFIPESLKNIYKLVITPPFYEVYLKSANLSLEYRTTNVENLIAWLNLMEQCE